MKRNVVLFILSFILLSFTKPDTLEKSKEKFPIEQLTFYKSTDHLKLVVFMPTLDIKCEYASMLTSAFNYYFVQKLAFEEELKEDIDVILVVNDENVWEKLEVKKQIKEGHLLNRNIIDGMTVNYDPEGVIFKRIFGHSKFKPNDSSVLYLLDRDNTILFTDADYRGQGEHLKPMEKVLKEALNIKDKTHKRNYQPVRVGRKAPSLESISEGNILEDPNYVKIVTFYPAAFSGILDVNINEENLDKEMNCSTQLSKFEDVLLNNNGLKIYAISSSTDELLYLWQNTLRTTNVIYLNDPTYEISKKFHAYNNKGYNNRVTYVIGKDGKVKYIEPRYNYRDKTLNRKLKECLSEK